MAEKTVQQLGDCHGDFKTDEWEHKKESRMCKDKKNWWTVDALTELVSMPMLEAYSHPKKDFH